MTQYVGIRATTVTTGTPTAASSIAATAVVVNTVTVPAVPYPTLQTCHSSNFQTLTVTTDAFDSDLRTAASGTATVGQVRSRRIGNGSSGGLSYAIRVPANTAQVWQTLLYRSVGTGLGSSVADGTLNYLRVTAMPVA